jgi:ribosomal protein S18 acetylase RimI-like enzyme
MLTIRPATPDDAETIIDLIRELAEYVKESDTIDITTDDIIQYGFEDNPIFHCLLCLCNDVPAGFALYFHTFSPTKGKPVIFLECFFIRPDYRRRGIGRALMSRLAEIAVRKGFVCFEWIVPEWNTPAIEFYRSLGGCHLSGMLPYRMDLEDMKTLANHED